MRKRIKSAILDVMARRRLWSPGDYESVTAGDLADILASPELRALIAEVPAPVASAAVAPLSRDQAIEACARAGTETDGDGREPHGVDREYAAKLPDARCTSREAGRAFADAVLTEARRHPVLASEPALRGGQ